jgi:hypothetical protein
LAESRKFKAIQNEDKVGFINGRALLKRPKKALKTDNHRGCLGRRAGIASAKSGRQMLRGIRGVLGVVADRVIGVFRELSFAVFAQSRTGSDSRAANSDRSPASLETEGRLERHAINLMTGATAEERGRILNDGRNAFVRGR